MKVLKFGGTSVGSVESILSLKAIVENEARRQPVIVVVSALGGITDKLLSTAQLALRGDEQWKDAFESMVDRHHKMIDTIITDNKNVKHSSTRSTPSSSSCAASISACISYTTSAARRKMPS